MITTCKALWVEESGQDIIEYTLLVAFVTFAAAALFVLGASGNLAGIWASGNGTLTTAANAAAS